MRSSAFDIKQIVKMNKKSKQNYTYTELIQATVLNIQSQIHKQNNEKKKESLQKCVD